MFYLYRDDRQWKIASQLSKGSFLSLENYPSWFAHAIVFCVIHRNNICCLDGFKMLREQHTEVLIYLKV